MPFINIKTNAEVSDVCGDRIKASLGKAITALPGKSESWLMVGIEPKYELWFKGDSSPAAMVTVNIYGTPSSSAMNDLTGKITSILSDNLSIHPDRIYVSYLCTDDWGWNGNNF